MILIKKGNFKETKRLKLTLGGSLIIQTGDYRFGPFADLEIGLEIRQGEEGEENHREGTMSQVYLEDGECI